MREKSARTYPLFIKEQEFEEPHIEFAFKIDFFGSQTLETHFATREKTFLST